MHLFPMLPAGMPFCRVRGSGPDIPAIKRIIKT